MASNNRADLLEQLFKVLKKHYQPVTTPNRNLLENLLFACCLEDAPYDKAEDCYARLEASYFDWNEVRVTTVRELGEVFGTIPNPISNALNLKNTLQSVFESQFTFDLEHLKKQNLGKTVALLESYKGTTPFTISYVTQHNLGGHSIPLGKGGIDIMTIIGAINEKEAAASKVPGLERTIPKSKGIEFSSLLHQLASDLIASPFSPKVRNILLEVDPECKSRLPKRIDKKKLEAEKKKKEEEERKLKKAAAASAQKAADAEKKKADAGEKKKKVVVKKKAATTETSSKEPSAPKKKTVKKKTTKKKMEVEKKSTPQKATKKVTKKKVVKKAATKASKKSASKQLARKKPR